MIKKILLPLLLIVISIGCKEYKAEKNSIYLNNLDCYISYYDWHFSDDPKLIGQAKDIFSQVDDTGVIKANIDSFGLQFFLFENPVGTPVEFNNNINLSISKNDYTLNVKNVSDYIKYSKTYMTEKQKFLKNLKITSEVVKKINGIECGIMEFTYEMDLGAQLLKLKAITLVTLSKDKIFIFTGSTLQKTYDAKSSMIKKILFSLRKKS